MDEPLYHYQLRADSVSAVADEGRYIQRMESFDALLEFARTKDIYDANKEILDYLYIKKATVGALRNRPSARAKIIDHTTSMIPDWRRNKLFLNDLRLRLALLLIRK